MGNAISAFSSGFSIVGLSDAVASFYFEHGLYILKLEDNLEDLQSANRRLEARGADMQNRIEIAERQGLQLLETARVHLLEVEEVKSQVCSLLADRTVEIERLCMYGFCSRGCISTYSYGKDVFEKLKTVNGILSSVEIEVVGIEGRLPPDIEEEPTQPTVGLENMLEASWNHLMDDGVGIFGLYGMGGVGKTTLLNQINNKFLEIRNEFHVVMSVVVSQDLQIKTIQRAIGKRLGLYNMEWEQKTKNEKAYDIYGVLTRKRFVMLLDDIWSKVDLKDIGIPVPSKANGSKVVITTRSKKVCGRMGTNVDMEVKCLEPANAWKLFQQKIGATTLARDEEITTLAKKVCGKCEGLPLALKVIGETMACKTTVKEWKHAIHILDSYAAEYPEVEEEILRVLKFSYDDLKDEIVQQCFQYCALLPEDHKIDTNMLVDYWICEGIINGGGEREEDLNRGHDIIGILVSACLLISLEFGAKVIMHDVVRQMAQWIASDFGKQKENFVVKTGAGLHQMPTVKDSNAVTRMSLGNNEIQNISIMQDYPHLTTLFLQQNKLVNIAGGSFLSMPMLVVLDLSWNSYLNKLPEDVSKLVALRYLGLAGTALKELPMGLRKLIQLRQLDLDLMDHLQSISVISSLLNLETLKVYDSTPLNMRSMEDIKLLKNLKFLSVTIRDISVLDCLLSIPGLARCTQGLFLKGCTALRGIGLVDSLHTLSIHGCFISDITVDWRNPISICVKPSDVCFQNLNSISISYVNGLKDLTWLLFAPNLATLNVTGPSHGMEEIISKDKATRIFNEQPNIKPFPKLKMIRLYSLVELKSIYWEPLPLRALQEIVLIQCPKLKKLPFNMESCKDNPIILVVDKDEQFDGVEWEDQATRDRFYLYREVLP